MFNRSISWLICMFTAVSTATLYRDPDYTKEWPVTESVREARQGAGEELGALLDAGTSAVVTLEAGGTRLAAHRAVLAARSPVLAAMLRHYSVEAGGRLSVTDVEGPVLRHLLAYLYTLRVPQLRPGTATQLLAAAHRFGLPALQADCERQVVAQLSAQTAASVGVLAVKHCLGDLRDTAVNFIKDHFFEVLATKGWSDAVKNQPKEVIELSHLLAGQPSKISAAATTETGATLTVEAGTTPTSEAVATPTAQPHSDHRTSPAAAVLTATNSTPTTAGVDVSRLLSLSEDEKGRRLMEAAEEGALEELNSLLEAGADVGSRDAEQNTALHWAARTGHVEAVKTLLCAGADVGAKDVGGSTALHWAAYKGHVEVVRSLLDAGAGADAENSPQDSPLHAAAWCGTRLLVASPAVPNARDEDGRTPLHLAALRGHTDVVAALLQAGADREAKDQNGKTPCDLARQTDSQQLIDMLSIVPQEIRQKMASQLLQAASDGRVREVWALLVAGVSKDARNEADGDTALHLAIAQGHASTVKCLLDGGLDVNAVNNGEQTPLHLAAKRGDVNLVWMLVVAAARVDAQDNQGRTPLHVASRECDSLEHALAVSGLLLAGARTDIKDTNGRTPESVSIWCSQAPFTTYRDLQ